MTRILIVEDDETLRVVLRDNLEEEGYAVVEAADGATALAALDAQPAEIVVLDIMLPDTDGYTLCQTMRQRGVRARILMLTARTLEDDLVRGLDAGADDYLTKPYRLRELLARVRALLRRPGEQSHGLPDGSSSSSPDNSPGTSGATSGDGANQSGERDILWCGPFRIDVAARAIRHRDGRVPRLTRTEFDLLCYFVRTAGRAVSRQEILDEVWGHDVIVDDRTVDNFVSSLKKKLGWKRGVEFKIHTVRGVGYRMELVGQES